MRLPDVILLLVVVRLDENVVDVLQHVQELLAPQARAEALLEVPRVLAQRYACLRLHADERTGEVLRVQSVPVAMHDDVSARRQARR